MVHLGQCSPPPHEKRVRAFAGILAVLVLGGLAYWYWAGTRARPLEGIVPIAVEQADEVLPPELPFDPDGAILENFSAGDGRVASVTRVYTTDEAVEAHRDAYAAYFDKHGWTVLDRVETSPGHVTLLAEKELTQLALAFDAVAGRTVVNVTLLQTPARSVAP